MNKVRTLSPGENVHPDRPEDALISYRPVQGTISDMVRTPAKVAGAVASEMRANDMVARYGGEEFTVILPNQSLKGAAIVAERIRCRVEQLQLPSTAPTRHVTVSIGAATAIAGPENTASQLVATADAALYRAKHLGRNRISLPETTLT